MIFFPAVEENIKTPLDMLYQWEEINPEGVFFRQPIAGQWHEFTWRQVGDQVRRMATALIARDYPQGSHIAIISKNCAHWVMADLAIWMAGHVSVPMYPNLNRESVGKILDHSDAKLVFVGKLDDWKEIQKGIPQEFPIIAFPYEPRENSASWDELIGAHEPLQGKVVRKLDEMATIIYTSGTTGEPKGVVHNFISPSYSATNVVKEFKITKDDTFFSYLPLAHVAERLLCETTPLYAGSKISFAESLSTFPDNVQETSPTIFLAVPRLWTKFKQKILVQVPQQKMSLLLNIPFLNKIVAKKIRTKLGIQNSRVIGSGAAAISDSLLRWFQKLGVNISDCYAMTENYAYSYVARPQAIRIGCSGQPLPGVDVKISDEGEVLIKCKADFVEYYKNPEETAKTFDKEGYIKTGDQGHLDDRGYLKITGRIKDLFKTSKGKYVAPSPIEKKISSNPYIEQICVVGDGMPSPIALVVLGEGTDLSKKDEISTSLEESRVRTNETLDGHEKVQKIIIVRETWSPENGFLTPTMKVKRPVVEKSYGTKIEAWTNESGNIIFE